MVQTKGSMAWCWPWLKLRDTECGCHVHFSRTFLTLSTMEACECQVPLVRECIGGRQTLECEFGEKMKVLWQPMGWFIHLIATPTHIPISFFIDKLPNLGPNSFTNRGCKAIIRNYNVSRNMMGITLFWEIRALEVDENCIFGFYCAYIGTRYILLRSPWPELFLEIEHPNSLNSTHFMLLTTFLE